MAGVTCFSRETRIPPSQRCTLAALDSTERTFLVNAVSSVEYRGGYLFYQRSGTLVAHPFDADAGRLTGEAIRVVENVRFNGANGRAAFSVSESGTLVYSSGDDINDREGRRVMLFDRSGKSPKPIGPVGSYAGASLSRDGQRAVVTIDVPGGALKRALSLLDLERGLLTRFTVLDADERDPIWSPDGSSIVFTSRRNGKNGLYRRSAAGGATADERLFETTDDLDATGFSSDGSILLFRSGPTVPQTRIWALPVTGDRKPVEVIPGLPMAQYQATFSPDDKWIAFGAGDGPGKGEIYIQPYRPTTAAYRSRPRPAVIRSGRPTGGTSCTGA